MLICHILAGVSSRPVFALYEQQVSGHDLSRYRGFHYQFITHALYRHRTFVQFAPYTYV